MANALLLTTAQVAYLAGVEPKDVRRRTKSAPGVEPLYALCESGIKGDCFDSQNVAACWPKAAAAIVASLTPKEDATDVKP